MSTEIKLVKDRPFDIIKSAINNAVDIIRPTYGPAGNKVIISKILFKGNPDDGVQIARELELPDPQENAVWHFSKETAIRTNDRVGDGTTSSLIILQAIINEVGRRLNFNGRKVVQELKRGAEELRVTLKKIARKIKTKEDLKKVALISFDDEKTAEMIATLYNKLGPDGIVTVAKSSTMETSLEMSDGVKLDQGYISPYMILDPERLESVLEKPHILITDYRLTDANDILPIMERMAEVNKRELVLICDNIEQSALATVVVNRMQGKFIVIAIAAPQGENRKVMLEDIALMTGARVFTESKGDKLQEAKVADLGRADRFICKRDESTIIGPKGKRTAINTAVNGLKTAIKNESNEGRKADMELRLSRFMNMVAVIKVGAPTESEQKTLKYKVEDAVNAVKVAFKGGVVCGAGLALATAKTSSPILNEALKQPRRQLYENMGMEDDLLLPKDSVLNVITGKTGNFVDVGVTDPADVLIAGVESAVSIASTLITTSGMIIESQKKPPIEN